MFRPWSVPEKDTWGIEITQGVFEGTVIQITEVRLIDNSSGNVEMDYHRIHTPAHLSETDFQGDNFSNVMSDIINQILLEAVQEYEQNRNNDTQKSS